MDSDKTSGQIPKSVECHLKNDLVESVTPGDVIDVTAVVSVILDPGSLTFARNFESF